MSWRTDRAGRLQVESTGVRNLTFRSQSHSEPAAFYLSTFAYVLSVQYRTDAFSENLPGAPPFVTPSKVPSRIRNLCRRGRRPVCIVHAAVGDYCRVVL